jgi:dCMP deaminase
VEVAVVENKISKNRLSWDEYFMGIALMSAKRSADPSTQVGCVIVRSDNRIVSLGYNGFPKGIEDGTFS